MNGSSPRVPSHVNAMTATGNTALHGAVNRGDTVVRLLVNRGAVLLKNNAGLTALDLRAWQHEDDLRAIRECAGETVLGVPFLLPQLALEAFVPRGVRC